jgi:MFS family permease
MTSLLSRLNETAFAFRAVFANANLRRLALAAFGSTIGIWGYLLAVSVYAFESNGAKAVALVWVIRTIPAALASPLLGVIADRYPRKRVMIASDVGRAGLIAAAAGLIWAGADPIGPYVLAGVITTVGMAFFPARAALLPTLTATPTELTTANVTMNSADSIGFFVGPALGAALLAVTTPQTVLVLMTIPTLWSAWLVSRIRPPEEEAETPVPGLAGEAPEGFGTQLLVGFKTIGADQRLLIIVVLFAATQAALGATEVLVVSVAIDLLGLGTSGVGYLNAAIGVGALLGAAVAAGFVGIRRLSVPFVCGAFLIGAPLALLGATSSTALAVLCLGLVGAGNTLLDVSGDTLLQRVAPQAVLARVWGVLQLTFLAAFAIGSALAPALLAGLSIQGTLAVVGLSVPVIVILLGPRLIQIDAAATAPAADRLELLRRSTIFAPLPGTTIERLATQLMPLSVPAGHVLIREGDVGDRFYLIAEGRMDVSVQGVAVATLGTGDPVGEIALLRDVPRTATVTSASDAELYALTREDFLEAVTSHVASRQTAEATITSRLAGLEGAIGGVVIPRV